jgi:hypothetical protein
VWRRGGDHPYSAVAERVVRGPSRLRQGDEAVARASILIAVLGSIGKPALIAVLKETDLAVTWNERKRVRAGGGGKHIYPNIADSEVP